MSLVIAFLILFASFPVGYVIRHLTKEEMKSGKQYFQIVWVVCLVIAVGMLFFPLNDNLYKQSMIFTLLFIANIAFISWR